MRCTRRHPGRHHPLRPNMTPTIAKREAFEWPPLPAFPKVIETLHGDPVFTEHQMQGYANAYGEAVRAALSATSPKQAADALTTGAVEPVAYLYERKESHEFKAALYVTLNAPENPEETREYGFTVTPLYA